MKQPVSYEDWSAQADMLEIDGRAFVAGERHDAKSGETFVRHSPIDGRPVGAIARCDRDDVNDAVRAARHAYTDGVWRHQEPAARKDVLLRWADLILEHRDRIALLETVELGKPITDTLNVDVPGCAGAIRFYAEMADKLYEELAPTGPNDLAVVKRAPLGVVAAITPWNYPLIIAGWKIGPALLMGNSVVLKPAEQSSLASLYIAELAVEAGLPKGVLNVITGYGAEAGAALSEHKDVDMITFTGSTQTGRAVMEAAATSNLKRVALELGGKSPQIVLEDCHDLDAAASAVAWSIFYNCGQTCHAGSRLIVHRSVAKELYGKIEDVARSIKRGHPLDPDTRIGALSDPVHLDRVMRYLSLAEEQKARILMGGNRETCVPGGCYIEPTLIAGIDADGALAQEEIFGPVIVSIEVDSDEEALRVANGTDYGLAASVWTSDMNKAHYFSEELVAGTVWINTYDQASMATPFGGFKQSGFGRDRSVHAVDKYADYKTVWTHFQRPGR